jgi:hypothetical protein
MSPEGESDGEEVWDDDDDVLQEFSGKAPPLPEEDDASLHSSPHHTLVMWYTGFLLLLQARHYISDAAMNLILKFMNIFFRVLSRFSSFLAPIASNIPSYTYQLRQTSRKVNFKRYVVCPRCHGLYFYQDCITKCGSRLSSKTSPFVEFPNHTQRQHRTPCGHILLRSVVFLSGKQPFTHLKYTHTPVFSQLYKIYFKNPDFLPPACTENQDPRQVSSVTSMMAKYGNS